MKKIKNYLASNSKALLMGFLLLSTFGSVKSQTILWSEDFNSVTTPSLPVAWKQNNVDGLTIVNQFFGSFMFGNNAWVTHLAAGVKQSWSSYGNSAVSTGFYMETNGLADDWLISPQFSVNPGTFIQWEAVKDESIPPANYQVLVSNTGTSVASFTPIDTIIDENKNWSLRATSLNTYSGQTVYVAFRHNSLASLLLIDNVKALIPINFDGAVTTFTSLERYMVAGNKAISGSFKNFGSATATNVVMNYKVDGGAPITQTFTFPGVAYLDSVSYSFTNLANLTPGAHTVIVQVESVNDVTETNTTNDTKSFICYCATQSCQRNVLIESFSSSSCMPCAIKNSHWDPTINSNNPNTGGLVNVIKYQMNWPGPTDPSYNPHGLKRRLFYSIGGIPDGYIDGFRQNPQGGYNQPTIDAAIQVPAWVDINANLTGLANDLIGTATITPYVTVNGPVRVYQALCQKFYNYPSAASNQKNYYHVMRTMNPNGAGSPTTITAGSPFTVNFIHTPNSVNTPTPNSFNFWTNNQNITYEYIVFLQDTLSKHVLNSGSSTFSLSTANIVKLEKNNLIGIYPNPANSYATIALKLNIETHVNIIIYDVAGKIVYSKEKELLATGQNEITINTENFKSGTYNVVLKTSNNQYSTKLVILK